MSFQWDPDEAESNSKKHGVEFADAVGVFTDELALSIEDPDSLSERRWVVIGRGLTDQLLTVVYTMRGEAIRIISARPATRRERRGYEEEV
jgi:uncharacterized DUF497 family protein